MPRPHPPEFRRRAVALARERAKPIAQIAADLGISESCLRRWMDVADVDAGHKEGLTSAEWGAGRAAPQAAGGGDGGRDPQAGRRLLRQEERAPKMTFTFIDERCSDLAVATCCRVMKVSTSAFYARRANPVPERDWATWC